MQREKKILFGKSAVTLITGMLFSGILLAESVFAADVTSISNDREVEVTYLNDAQPDEIVLMENVSEELIVGGGNGTGLDIYFTDINDSTRVSITGVEDQPWTGKPVTLPDLKVTKDSSLLNEVRDYTVSYTNNTDPGQASVTISGTGSEEGRLVGSITKKFQIIKEQGTETETDKEPKVPTITSVPKGTKLSIGRSAAKADYTVTGSNTVTFAKSKAGKNASTVKVPDTISYAGQTYKVTAIAKKAFYGMSKLKKVTVGVNVTSIGASAFGKCRKLKTLVVKSTILKASKCKKCLTGSSIKTVKVPATVKKTYKKKIFVKKICGLKVTVK